MIKCAGERLTPPVLFTRLWPSTSKSTAKSERLIEHKNVYPMESKQNEGEKE